jgi:hypothetical protein
MNDPHKIVVNNVAPIFIFYFLLPSLISLSFLIFTRNFILFVSLLFFLGCFHDLDIVFMLLVYFKVFMTCVSKLPLVHF